MLGKVIKHEFRASARLMVPLLLGIFGLAVLVRVAAIPMMKPDNLLVNSAAGLLVVVFTMGMFAMAFAPLVVSCSRFKTGILGDEGYLTMSLPTSACSIIGGRLVSNAVWYAITGAILTFITVLMFVSLDMLTLPGLSFRIDMQLLPEGLSFGTILLHGVIIFLEAILLFTAFVTMITLMVYVSYAVGYGVKKHKSFCTFALIYLLSHFTFGASAVYTIKLFAVYGFDSSSFASTVSSIEGLMLVPVSVMLIISAIYYFITVLFIRFKLNLE